MKKSVNQAINLLKICTVLLSHEGGKNHDGTGFFVAHGLIITCAHVCQKFQSYKAYATWNKGNKTSLFTFKRKGKCW